MEPSQCTDPLLLLSCHSLASKKVNSAEFGQNFLKMQPIDMNEQDLAPGAYKVPNPSKGCSPLAL